MKAGIFIYFKQENIFLEIPTDSYRRIHIKSEIMA